MSMGALYDKYHNHLRLLQTAGLANGLTGDYICPLCLASYTQQEVNTDAITIEHAPQHALKGHAKALTCKTCNNEAGNEIDCHLINMIERLEFKEKVDGSERAGSFEVSKNRINGALVYNNGHCELRLPIQQNDRRIDLGKLMTKGDEFEFQGKVVKYNANCGMAAILKNAYILLFARIGYPILASHHYDILRNFINNPYRYFLPRPLCRIEPSSTIKDGIYLFQTSEIKGFLVIYSVGRKATEKVFVYLPALTTTFARLSRLVRKVTNGGKLKLHELSDAEDFLNDINKCRSLLAWANSHTMTIQEI